MKKPLLISLVLLGFLALAATLWRELRRDAHLTAYQGRPIQAWALQLSSPDAKAREAATAAFQALGATAVPALNELLQAKESLLRQRAWALAFQMPLRWRVALLSRVGPPQAATLHGAAARALATLGPQARGAVPLL
ncbi:MAG TPA: hypothetical protein VNZ22_04140, partial [Bacillota bacterium]|nr:hypothetical protein [Bacillota bacterium]